MPTGAPHKIASYNLWRRCDSLQEFLRTAAVPRETIDRFLAEDHPTWARFDPEVGYTLGRYLPRDGIDNSWTVSTAHDNGQRTSGIYVDRPCRINTYGNSFTQCHQVSDGETWQEYLAAHLGEPVRNFGMGGFGTYQAYRRMRRTEIDDMGTRHVILYIWGDDLMVILYGMGCFEVEGDADRLNRLAEHLGVPGIDNTDPDARMASATALKQAYGFAASRYIATEARSFLSALDKELLICLLCPMATDQLLRGRPRYDQPFADYLHREGFRGFDMNEVHRADFQAFNLSADDYRKRYWIGHYSPAGNHFFGL